MKPPLLDRLPPIFKDMGVSASLLILMTCSTVGLTIYAFAVGKMAEAAGPLASFGILNTMFWNGYLAKRKEDEERRERMNGTGNGGEKPLVPPGS